MDFDKLIPTTGGITYADLAAAAEKMSALRSTRPVLKFDPGSVEQKLIDELKKPIEKIIADLPASKQTNEFSHYGVPPWLDSHTLAQWIMLDKLAKNRF